MKDSDMKRGTVVSVLCEVVSCPYFNINKNAFQQDAYRPRVDRIPGLPSPEGRGGGWWSALGGGGGVIPGLPMGGGADPLPRGQTKTPAKHYLPPYFVCGR